MTYPDFSITDHLPKTIRARHIDNGNGLNMHFLEAGADHPDRPCLLLLHGFPELAFSWRYIMPALAEAGYYVIAPDQRGYGWTSGPKVTYESDITASKLLNLVQDQLGLLAALGRDHVAAVIGHDFGAPVAANAAMIRPDIFQSAVLMSAPFGGPPALANSQKQSPGLAGAGANIHHQMANLARPRKHYQWYYSTPEADADMCAAPQGLHAFLRAYYHVKSADWAENKPFQLAGWQADELAKMPTYYIMDHGENMAQTVAPHMPPAPHIAACKWLSEADLTVYSRAYAATTFQGGLQWYRCATNPQLSAEMRVFAGRTLDVPSLFIAGQSDWGVFQKPGDFERMQDTICPDMRGCHLIDGAGHWVQQEQPAAVTHHLLHFLNGLNP